MPRHYPYPADTPNDCADCGRPCRGRRCVACFRQYSRGRPRRGVPVRAADGREWPSVTALAREWGMTQHAACRHLERAGDHWYLREARYAPAD